MLSIAENENIRLISVSPKLADRLTGEQKVRDGVPLWSCVALHQPDDGSKPQLLTVTVPSPQEPAFTPMQAKFRDLQVDFYQVGGNDGSAPSAGLWFRAAGIVEVKA